MHSRVKRTLLIAALSLILTILVWAVVFHDKKVGVDPGKTVKARSGSSNAFESFHSAFYRREPSVEITSAVPRDDSEIEICSIVFASKKVPLSDEAEKVLRTGWKNYMKIHRMLENLSDDEALRIIHLRATQKALFIDDFNLAQLANEQPFPQDALTALSNVAHWAGQTEKMP